MSPEAREAIAQLESQEGIDHGVGELPLAVARELFENGYMQSWPKLKRGQESVLVRLTR